MEDVKKEIIEILKEKDENGELIFNIGASIFIKAVLEMDSGNIDRVNEAISVLEKENDIVSFLNQKFIAFEIDGSDAMMLDGAIKHFINKNKLDECFNTYPSDESKMMAQDNIIKYSIKNYRNIDINRLAVFNHINDMVKNGIDNIMDYESKIIINYLSNTSNIKNIDVLIDSVIDNGFFLDEMNFYYAIETII